MKKLMILALVFMFAGCARTTIISKEFKPANFVHYEELATIENMSAINSYVVYLNNGDTLPLELSFETDFVDIAEKSVNIVAKHKTYFMLKLPENISKEKLSEIENLTKKKMTEMGEPERRKLFSNIMLYISKDAINWAPVSDINAIKEVMGIKGGAISFGMGMSKEDGLWSYLGIKQVK